MLAWTLQARLLAHQGRWDEFLALVDGTLAELRYRSPHVARLMLWHPDPAALTRLACPLLAPLRGDPRFMELRGRVRLRADTVAEALWS